jgi:hypothetical protein
MKKPESSRKAYIRLLKERVDVADNLPLDERDRVFKAELINDGCLDGVVGMDSSGMFPSSVIIGLPKPKGRLLLQQLEQEEADATAIGKLKKKTDLFLGLILGIISTVAGAIILHLLHLPT